MNDFTKEDLENIHNSIVMMINLHDAPYELFDLRDKIQPMIDNYCEHKPSEPKLLLIKHCIKCEQHLETRAWGPE